MKFVESISDFFQQPNYIKNLLFAGLCALIPVVGPIVLMGWLAIGFWDREDQDPRTFPDFDFSKFSIYLQRGVWPFLVMFAAIFGAWIVGMIVLGIPGTILGWITGQNGFLSLISGFIMFVLGSAFWISVLMVLKPLKIRAVQVQDFSQSFNLDFITKFIKITWKETLLSTLFLVVISMVLIPAGALVLCVGMCIAMAIVFYATEHLDRQLYQIYLLRGGEPVPVNPALVTPPPMA